MSSVQGESSDAEYIEWTHMDSNTILAQGNVIVAPNDDHKYSVVGSHETDREYNLQISRVELSDQGVYRCTYGQEYRSAFLTVVVVSPGAKYPICSVSTDPRRQVTGGLAEIRCVSKGGKPAASLVWHRNGVRIGSPGFHVNSLQRVITAEDNGAVFSCVSEFSVQSVKRFRSCRTQVMNIPPVGVISPSLMTTQVGETATFTCSGEGIPTIVRYRWLVNRVQVAIDERHRLPRYQLVDNNRVLKILDVKRYENGVDIECEVAVASGLASLARAKLSVVPAGSNVPLFPNVHSPSVNQGDIANPDGSGISTTIHRPPNSTIAGIVVGAIMATVGLCLAVITIAVIYMRGKLSRRMIDLDEAILDIKSKNFDDPGILPTATTVCPIYAQPNKVRKEKVDTSQPVNAANAYIETQKKKQSRKNTNSYEIVELISEQGDLTTSGLNHNRSHTLPTVKLQSRALPIRSYTRGTAVRSLKARAPNPPDMLSGPVHLPLPMIPNPPTNISTVYADLDLQDTQQDIVLDSEKRHNVNYATVCNNSKEFH